MLTFVSATLGGLSAAGYCVGRGTESDLRFFEPRRAPTVDEAVITYPIEYSLRSSERNDVIFLGDSTCRCGIDPAQFERLTGLRSYNLGSQGRAGPIALLITAKAYLATHPPPKLLVLCVTPVVFDADTSRIEELMRDRFLANYGPEVTGVVPTQESLLYFIRRGSLTVARAPLSLISGSPRDVRDLPLSGLEMETCRSLQRSTQDMRGFRSLPGLHHKEKLWLWRKGKPVAIPDVWDRNVRALAETCRSRGIPLLIRFSPMPRECLSMRDYSPVEKWSQEMQGSCPGLTIGQPTLTWYDWELCWDAFHLNAQGVAKYTPFLATQVRAVLASAEASARH
jgi:hypothetical protein